MEKKVHKWTLEQLKSHVISEAMKMINKGEALEVEMNKLDGAAMSDGAKVKSKENGSFETKVSSPEAGSENIDKTVDTTDVKMNQAPSKGGSDEKAAAAVGVEAGAKGENGQAKPKFESKEKQPSTEASTPFEEKKEPEMNEMDNKGEEGTKTYVEAGAKGSDGQPAAKFSEEAKNEKEKVAKIADAIQLPETFKNKKEMLDFISEQAKKVAKLL